MILTLSLGGLALAAVCFAFETWAERKAQRRRDDLARRFGELVAESQRYEVSGASLVKAGGWAHVLPSERRAFARGEAWHQAFAPRAVDLDTIEAANRALDLAFKATRFDGEA